MWKFFRISKRLNSTGKCHSCVHYRKSCRGQLTCVGNGQRDPDHMEVKEVWYIYIYIYIYIYTNERGK